MEWTPPRGMVDVEAKLSMIEKEERAEEKLKENDNS